LNPIHQKHFETLNILYRLLVQAREDKNKVYSIHEPEELCIAKGKEHKSYEFGNKSSFAYTRHGGRSNQHIIGLTRLIGHITKVFA
jgi:IS5 family transposase